jgi:hypothetical protein
MLERLHAIPGVFYTHAAPESPGELLQVPSVRAVTHVLDVVILIDISETLLAVSPPA